MTTPSKADELRPARIAMNLYARMSDCGNPDCIDTNMCADCEQSLGLLGDYVTNLITTTLTQELIPIPGFSGYSINRAGELYSHKTKRYLKFTKGSRDGYYVCALQDDKGHQITKRRGRLLATIFLPNPDNLPQVNHIDGNKTNDALENLEWCTPQYNAIHAFRTGLNVAANGEKAGKSKLTAEQVLEIRKRHAEGETVQQIHKDYPVNENNIRRIIQRKNWFHI